MYNRYNQTKSSLKHHDSSIKIEEHSHRQRLTEGSDESDSFTGVDKEMDFLKKEIYHKIDEVIQESINPPAMTDTLASERFYNESQNTKRNLRQLRQSIEDKEKLEAVAVRKLKDKEKRAKEKVKVFKRKVQDMEILLNDKENIIEKLEGDVKDTRREMEKSSY